MKQAKRILWYLRPHMHLAAGAMLCTLVGTLLSLYIPVLIGRAVDYILTDREGLLVTCIYLFMAVSFSALFSWVFALLGNRVTLVAAKRIRTDLSEKVSRLPQQFLDRTLHGDFNNRVINDVEFVSDGLLQGITQLFTGIVTILGTLVFMLLMNPRITLVVVLVTPLSVFAAAFITKRTHRYFQEQSAIQGEMSGFVTQMLSGHQLVKAFGQEAAIAQALREMNDRLYQSGQKAQFSSSLANPCTRFVNLIVFTLVGVTGAFGVMNGMITVGQLSGFLAYANQYTKPFNEVSGILTQLSAAAAAAGRIFAVIDTPEEILEQEKEITECKGFVSFRDVSFSYEPERPLIRNFDLEVVPGQKIAVVGPTGSGKTTLMNLLMRFYEIQAGEILFDGQNTRSMTRDSLRRLFGMVLQDSWLFSGTIWENIAFGRPGATREEIVAAATEAHAHEFIERLPDGYDTYITADGDSLSAGQRQLIGISRVMLTRPPMLILDEATSSIDTRTEVLIQQAFSAMMNGRTSFIVAHRLSTIREADVILVMNGGDVVEQGTHAGLMQKGGFYARLYGSQFANEDNIE